MCVRMLSLVSISSQSVISFVNDVPEPPPAAAYPKNPCDFPAGRLLSVVLKTVFLEDEFESQELCLFFDTGEFRVGRNDGRNAAAARPPGGRSTTVQLFIFFFFSKKRSLVPLQMAHFRSFSQHKSETEV